MYLGGMYVEQSKRSKMSVFELLMLRYQWEEIVKDFMLPEAAKHGTVDNLRWFITNGAKANRFRKGYQEAIETAEKILENA